MTRNVNEPNEPNEPIDSVAASAPIRVSSPDALIAAVPYLLGFHPERSLVVIWSAPVTVPMVMRVDLPAADAERTTINAAYAQVVESVLRPVPQVPEDAVPFIVVYPDEFGSEGEPLTPGRLPHGDLVIPIAAQLASIDRAPRDALCVSGGRWWSYLCTSESCCDLCGREIDATATTEVAAHFVMAGRAPVARRSEIEAELTPASPAQIRRVRSAITALGVRVSTRTIHDNLEARVRVRCWRAVTEVAHGTSPATVDEQALVLLGLRDARVRDAFLALAVRSAPDRAAEALAPLVRLAPRRFRAQAAGALAMLRYVTGDGARAWVAIDASLSDADGCRLTELVSAALLGGLPPRLMRDTFHSLDPHRLLRGEAA